MSKNFITIFSNITSLLISRDEARKEELKKLEEAKKEAEEEENFKIYGYRWPNDYMKSHKQDYLDGKMSGYAYDPSYYNYGSSSYYNSYNSDYCTIYFYEWSSLDCNQRKFYSYSNFYRFCDDCGIKVSEDDKSQLRGMTIAYITCIPGKNELMSACTSYALQSLLDKYKTEHKEEVKV